MSSELKQVETWYNKTYAEQKFAAQRLYPNEELLRFLGRNYFSKLKRENRESIKVLELGCGSCANLWMVAREGFDTYGIDLSSEAIELGHEMLKHWSVNATLEVASMDDLPYDDNSFDVIFDVFSAYCLTDELFQKCLKEVKKCLKPGGKFFSYTPSTGSELFQNYAPAEKLDEYTFNGVYRKGAPYFGQQYPFRFISTEHLKELTENLGFVNYECEKISRTYKNQEEYFEFLSASVEKPGV